MKRIIIGIFILLQVFTGTANNTIDLDSVFSCLWDLKYIDNTDRGLIMSRSCSFSGILFEGDNCLSKPGGFADEESLVCFITETLDQVCREADESYRFESHKAGMDTIMYSICILPSQTSAAHRYGSRIFYDGAKEALSFEYFRDAHNNHSNGHLYYTSVVNNMYKDVGPFDVKSYECAIKLILDQQGVRAYLNPFCRSVWTRTGRACSKD